MTVRSLNGLNGTTTNVYLNRDPIEATLPVQAIQTTVNDPITISLKGLSTTFQGAGKVIKINSNNDGLEYTDDIGSNWTLNSSNLYPLATTTNVLIGTTSNTSNRKLLVDGTGEFKGQLTIDTTGAELSNGTHTYTLPSSTGTLALTTQIPTNNNQLTNGAGFITASSSDTLTNKSISYSQLTSTPTIPTNNNELTNGSGFITASSSDTLTNKSISYSQLTSTPTIPTNNNQLTNGAGFITATAVIPALKGGTGLSTLTQNKILQVNFAADGYDLVDLPTSGSSNWTLTNNNLYPTNYATTTVSINNNAVQSGYVFQVQGDQYHNGIMRLNGDLQTRNGSNGINYASGNIQKVVSNSVAYTYSLPSSTGTFALTESDIKTNNIEAVSGGEVVVADVLNVDGTIKGADESMIFEVSGNFTHFYSSKYGGAANFQDNIFAYGSNKSGIYFNIPGGGTSIGDYFSFATLESQKARIDMTGSGKITGSWTGSWGGTSDRRLKENIVPIENAIETLMKINVYQFDKYDLDNFDCIHSSDPCGKDCMKPFKERLSKNTRFVYGFIAQELCEDTPEIGKMCVETNDWGDEEPAYVIDDRPILACAVKTIQTQQEQINTLRTELDNYKLLMDKLINSKSFSEFKKNID